MSGSVVVGAVAVAFAVAAPAQAPAPAQAQAPAQAVVKPTTTGTGTGTSPLPCTFGAFPNTVTNYARCIAPATQQWYYTEECGIYVGKDRFSWYGFGHTITGSGTSSVNCQRNGASTVTAHVDLGSDGN